jgi:nucleoside-triphosphatase
MESIPNIGITGLSNVGKTETLLKIVKKLEKDGYRVGGMLTTCARENGNRIGFNIENWQTGEKKIFALIGLDSSYRIGDYGIDLKSLDSVGTQAIQKAIEDEAIDIVIIDEVGKMEMLSERFCEAVRDALNSDKITIMTLHKKSRNSLLQDIRRRDDIRILEVTYVNKNLLPFKIEKILKHG